MQVYAKICLLWLAGVACISTPASANAMRTGTYTSPPLGFIKYCLRNYSECARKSENPGVAELSQSTWRQLQDVQLAGNRLIRPQSDLDNAGLPDSWDYPRNGSGDCEDFAILKRRMLIERGWPADSMLLTTAITEQGEHHVVLTVTTDSGDFILDNRYVQVQAWEDMKYTWLARQDPRNLMRWVTTQQPEQRIARLSN